MRIIIELDGPIFDMAPVHFAAHHQAAGEVGWSRMPQADYWRLVRTKGREANVLPGAKPAKIKEYHERFDRAVESDALLSAARPQDGAERVLTRLTKAASCVAVTLGANVAVRRTVLERLALSRFFTQTEGLGSATLPPAPSLEGMESGADPRRRPAELRVLAAGERRVVVAAASDALIRAAREAGFFALGISNGPCSTARLQQAGADVVYKSLEELADSIETGGADLIRAGLPPISFSDARS